MNWKAIFIKSLLWWIGVSLMLLIVLSDQDSKELQKLILWLLPLSPIVFIPAAFVEYLLDKKFRK